MSSKTRAPSGSISRRHLLGGIAAGAAVATFAPTRFAIAQQAKYKVGFMLPYSGTFAALGANITDAFKMYVDQNGGKLGGREVEYIQVDDESQPGKAPQNMNKLVKGDRVDVVVGTVHSGVAMAMAKIANDENQLLLVPNAGANAITGAMCSNNIFRTSFSNSQVTAPLGKVAWDKGYRNVVTMSWGYAAGEESVGGFEEEFKKLGGKIVERIMVPFPNVEFQASLTKIAGMKPDAVMVFYAGGGAVKFVKDYAAAGLKASIPLIGSGFITEGTLAAQGADAEGILSTLHYSDEIDTDLNKKVRADFQARTGRVSDVYTVQGYDTAALLKIGMDAVKGDASGARDAMVKAMAAAKIMSPRGPLSFDKSHNPVHNIYLREVKGGKNVVAAVAAENYGWSSPGCKMAG